VRRDLLDSARRGVQPAGGRKGGERLATAQRCAAISSCAQHQQGSGAYCSFVDAAINDNCATSDVTIAPPYVWAALVDGIWPLIRRQFADDFPT
jgi:hypothetical protein